MIQTHFKEQFVKILT